jgi:hypothetical protein
MEGTSTPTSTGSTTTGPTTFSEMPSTAWSDAPSASAPATANTPADQSTATTTPSPETVPVEGQPQQGEPPKERWNDILANARTKAAQDADAKWQQYAWAKQIDPQDFQQVQSITRHFKPGGDPIEGLQSLMAEIRKDPANDARIRSLAARALSQRSQPQAPTEPQMVQVQLEDGTVVAMPRDPATWLEHQKQQWLSQVEQKFQPLVKAHETTQAERQIEAQNQYVKQVSDATYDDAKTWAGMDSLENQIAVAQAMETMVPDNASIEQVQLALNAAYRKVVLPKLSSSTEAKLLDSLKTRAAASTSVNPGSAAASASRQVARFQDLGPDAWR